jgi:3',5'-cyclic AMP phosphodiesterase CpdA
MGEATRFSTMVLVLIGITACDFFYDSRGPYLQSPSSTSILIKWRTGKAVPSQVHYGTSSGKWDRLVESAADTRNHEVLLDNLEPATRYYYKVSGLEGKAFYFNTAPGEGEARPVRVWVLGDSGSGDERAEKVRDAFYRFNEGPGADFILLLGDAAYDVGSDTNYQEAFFEMYPDTLATTPVFSTPGNHDFKTDQGAPYFEIFSLPIDGKTGGKASGTESYYSFNFANIHFVSLDTEVSDRSPDGAMYRWLVADLKANQQDWTVAFFHHPLYSKGRHDSDGKRSVMAELREHYTPIFETYGVDLIFSGHNHSYERSFPLLGHRGTSDTFMESMKADSGNGRIDGDGEYRKTGTGDGVIYIVAGSAGKAHTYPLNHPANYVSMAELGSMVLDFDGNELKATFVSPNPQAIDYFSVVKEID